MCVAFFSFPTASPLWSSALRRHVNNFSRARLLSPLSAFLFLFLAAAALPLLSREEEIRAGFANKTNERRIFEERWIYTNLLVF